MKKQTSSVNLTGKDIEVVLFEIFVVNPHAVQLTLTVLLGAFTNCSRLSVATANLLADSANQS